MVQINMTNCCACLNHAHCAMPMGAGLRLTCQILRQQTAKSFSNVCAVVVPDGSVVVVLPASEADSQMGALLE